MISSLISTLRAKDIEPTAEELADALWFAIQIKPFVAPVSVPDIRPPLSRPEKPLSSTSDTAQQTEEPAPSITPPKPIHSEKPTPEKPTLSASKTQSQTSESYPLYPHTARPVQKRGSRPFRTPAATMLPGALSLEKALRPLMLQVPSRTHYRLDEAATVQRIAEQAIWLPVLQGTPERWFEVALIIDHSASMVIWQPTIAEWRSLLERHGAFRNVRTWSLKNKADQIQLYAGSRSCHPRELIDPLGRRLILVVSDCVAAPWYTGAMTRLLELWGKHNPVAIVQMLPQRLWASSALGDASRVNLQGAMPGLANAQLIVDEDNFWIDDEEKPTGMKMPIITLEPESLRFWARVLMGKADNWTPGVVFESSANQQNNAPPIQPTTNENRPTPEQRVQHFYATASPMAQELAGYLAAAPLTLPVMRLVQQVMLPESRQLHLAEVFLGGLLKRVSPEKCNPMVMEYDFHDKVRDLMLDSVLVPDSIEVLKTVSKYLERRLGQPLDFMAWLLDPTAIDGIVIDEENRAFAEIGAQVLGRLGGDYGKLAKRIKTAIDINDSTMDSELLNRQEFYTEIYQKYEAELSVYLTREFTNLSTELLEDVLQETFFKFFKFHKNLNQFQKENNVLPWLYKVALNTCIDYLRQSKKHREFLDELEDDDFLDDFFIITDKSNLERKICYQMCIKKGLKLFEKEFPDSVEVIELRLEGWTIKEIAEKIGKTKNATAVFLSVAFGKLRPYFRHCLDDCKKL